MVGMDTSQLMQVYRETTEEDGKRKYPDASAYWQLLYAEEDFLSYLRDVFFKSRFAIYAVWSVDGVYKAALRLEPYRDGLLLEGLETAPEARRKGYATKLLSYVLSHLQDCEFSYVYSHVHKRNLSSVSLHKKIGFQIISDMAVYIDGTVTQQSYTFGRSLK